MVNHLSDATVEKIKALFDDGYGVRQISRALKIDRGTVAAYAKKFQPEKCICGQRARHKGWCLARMLKGPPHREFLAKLHADYKEPIRPTKPVRSAKTQIRLFYPYCVGGPGEGNALITSVDAIVSKRIPEQDRADICQDLLVSILDGSIKMERLTDAVRPAINKNARMKTERTGTRHMSLDAPMYKEGDGDSIRLLDTIPSDYEPISSKRSVSWAARRKSKLNGKSRLSHSK